MPLRQSLEAWVTGGTISQPKSWGGGKGNGLELRVPEVHKATFDFKNCCD